MATPVGAVKASDPWEMALIHRVIRRGFEQARAHVVAAGAESRAAAVAAYVDFQLDGLYAHHSSEDELLWPRLLERAELSAALIHRMEQQHVAVHEAVDRPALRSPPGVRRRPLMARSRSVPRSRPCPRDSQNTWGRRSATSYR